MKDVVIVGGRPAGLSLSLCLQEHGIGLPTLERGRSARRARNMSRVLSCLARRPGTDWTSLTCVTPSGPCTCAPPVPTREDFLATWMRSPGRTGSACGAAPATAARRGSGGFRRLSTGERGDRVPLPRGRRRGHHDPPLSGDPGVAGNPCVPLERFRETAWRTTGSGCW